MESRRRPTKSVDNGVKYFGESTRLQTGWQVCRRKQLIDAFLQAYKSFWRASKVATLFTLRVLTLERQRRSTRADIVIPPNYRKDFIRKIMTQEESEKGIRRYKIKYSILFAIGNENQPENAMARN